MMKHWVASAIAVVLSAGGAIAQTAAPEPTRATNGPAGTVETTHTGIAVDGTGAAAASRDTFKKSQSYSNDNGQLSAKTRIQTTGTPAPPAK
jgi:hypothetical protein